MKQLKSIYNSPFKDWHSHSIHTSLATIPSNEFITFCIENDKIFSADQGFSHTGVPSYYQAKFSQKLNENEENLAERGTSKILSCRSTTDICPCFFMFTSDSFA